MATLSALPAAADFRVCNNTSSRVGVAIGYKDKVILPLQIVPREPGKPVVLRLDLDYAICEKLCVPAEAKAKFDAKVNSAQPFPEKQG